MTDYDWAADRGEQWLAQLSGLEAMMAEIDEPLIAALNLEFNSSTSAPPRIADIACGGGGTTFKLEHAAPLNSEINGFDISSALVEFANSKAARANSQAKFLVANIQTAPAPREGYDFVLSRFGIMFFDKPEVAFRNIRKWLTPAGHFAFAVWGNPKQNPWMMLLKEVASQFVEVPKPEYDSPGPFRYAENALLLGELDAAGFKQIKVSEWRGELPIGGGLSPHDAANFALNAFTFGELLRDAGENVFEQAKKQLVEMYTVQSKDGKVFMDACVHIVKGCA